MTEKVFRILAVAVAVSILLSCTLDVTAQKQTISPSGSYLLAAARKGAAEPARYRVFALKRISAEQGKKYLNDAKVGTVSQLPGVNMLLVSAQRRRLNKASAILNLAGCDSTLERADCRGGRRYNNRHFLPSPDQQNRKQGDYRHARWSCDSHRTGRAA